MISRTINTTAYNLSYDAENHLVGVTWGTNSATFVYDGDGKRVKVTLNTATTSVYIGNYYEVSSGTVKKYYYSGGQRVAMRDSGTVKFLLTDHLGSTNFTMSSGGAWLGSVRYLPFGSVVQSSGTTPTRYKYTGQPEADAGLYDYGARFYDPALGRFIQPDTIVPPGVQGYDRYAYVNNSPVMYNDPTGHVVPDNSNPFWPTGPVYQNDWLSKYGIPGLPEIINMALSLTPFVLDSDSGTIRWETKEESMQKGIMMLVAGDIIPDIPAPEGGAYSLRNPGTGDVVRVGRTKDFSMREAQYSRDPNFFDLQFTPEYYTDDYATQRGLEQKLYNVNNQPPLNINKPIGPRNVNGPNYLIAAEVFLSKLLKAK